MEEWLDLSAQLRSGDPGPMRGGVISACGVMSRHSTIVECLSIVYSNELAISYFNACFACCMA